MMQFKFDEESNDEEANNTDSGINNNTKVVAVKRDLFVSSLPIDRGVDAPLRQSKGDWRTEASRRHTSSAYRRQQQQTVPNNLRASLRSHGHGMSLVNVNTEQSHANNITPDYHEHILQQFGLFTNGLSTRVALNAQEKKAEERHRKQVLGFAFRVICNTQLLFAIVSYIAVTAVIVHVQAIRESAFVEWLSASHSGMAFFSAFVGLILVFRTQICYNRWWEGRCLWGTLIFAAINLAQQGQGSFTEKENFRRLCCLIVCFAFACKNQLHGLSIEADGEYLLSRGLMNRNEFDQVIKRPGWQPYYFLGALREIIDVDLCKSGQLRFSNTDLYSFKGSTTDAQLLMMDGALGQMANIIGDLIRVKATGLPLGYDTIFYFIFLVYFLVTTLSWAVLLQWYTPILMGLLHLVVRCITELGTCLEDVSRKLSCCMLLVQDDDINSLIASLTAVW